MFVVAQPAANPIAARSGANNSIILKRCFPVRACFLLFIIVNVVSYFFLGCCSPLMLEHAVEAVGLAGGAGIIKLHETIDHRETSAHRLPIGVRAARQVGTE